jgi:hypothetical protein
MEKGHAGEKGRGRRPPGRRGRAVAPAVGGEEERRCRPPGEKGRGSVATMVKGTGSSEMGLMLSFFRRVYFFRSACWVHPDLNGCPDFLCPTDPNRLNRTDLNTKIDRQLEMPSGDKINKNPVVTTNLRASMRMYANILQV